MMPADIVESSKGRIDPNSRGRAGRAEQREGTHDEAFDRHADRVGTASGDL